MSYLALSCCRSRSVFTCSFPCHIEPVLLCELFTCLFVSVAVVLVGNGFAVIIHSVEYDVAVRMLTVSMTGNDELGISDAHLLHVLVSNFYHQPVVIPQSVTVFRRETEGNMSDSILRLIVQQCLQLKLLCHFFGSARHTFRCQQPCFILTENIGNATGKLRAFSS